MNRNQQQQQQSSFAAQNRGLMGQQNLQNQGLQNQGLQNRAMGQQNLSSQYVSQQSSGASTVIREQLPRQVIERPTAVHEQIRCEQVEEIQPVINIEKYQTQVVQKTQPLLDREVRPVNIQQVTLPSQLLPEIIYSGGAPVAQDISTVNYLNRESMTVEKPAIVHEVDKTRVIEEIQPVIYKETVIPSLIKETQPMYQKIVEGTVYSQQTLPAQQMTSHYPTNPVGIEPIITQPRAFQQRQVQFVQQQVPVVQCQLPHKQIITETTVTNTIDQAPPNRPMAQ